jgi:hypothetical protein
MSDNTLKAYRFTLLIIALIIAMTYIHIETKPVKTSSELYERQLNTCIEKALRFPEGRNVEDCYKIRKP